MTGILGALSSGYTARQILRYLSQHNPRLGQQITAALNAGHTIDHVLNYINKHQKKIGKLIPEKQEEKPSDNLFKTAQKSVHPALKGMAQTAGVALAAGTAAAGGAYALSHALPRAITPQVLPALQGAAQQPRQLGNTTINIPQNQLSYQQAQIPNNQPNLAQPIQPNVINQPVKNPTKPNIAPKVKSLDAVSILTKHKAKDQIDKLVNSGNDFQRVAGYFRHFNQKQVKEIEKETGEPFENIIEQYILQNPSTQNELNPIETETENVQETATQPQEQPNIELAPQKLPKQEPEISKEIEIIEEPEELEKPKEIKKSEEVSTPKGIGKVLELRNGKAIIEIDGKKKVFNEEDLEKKPQDIEEAIRHVINYIPENLKSTAMQSTVHIPGLNVMITKFWDGKVAWYTDVSEELYRTIAKGLYEPKTKGRTGIGEYKPGAIDSRGAGNSEQITRNPKYSKENKGKTWGYANNEYDAFDHIQNILNKISKEKYDEEGNLIQPKKKKK